MKKLLTGALALALSVSLAACSKSDAGDGGPSATAPVGSSTSSAPGLTSTDTGTAADTLPPTATDGSGTTGGSATPSVTARPADQTTPEAAMTSWLAAMVSGDGNTVCRLMSTGGKPIPSIPGAEAACVKCHQRSGLGSVEGSLSFPPVTGDYLFHSRAHDASEPALPYVESSHGNRDPYTDETLPRAIREGLDSQGRPLSYLMPRFALGDDDMAALIDYLKNLGQRQVPGVTDTVLHFATIVTPDADPVKRRGMLDVLKHFVAEKNSFPFKPSPTM